MNRIAVTHAQQVRSFAIGSTPCHQRTRAPPTRFRRECPDSRQDHGRGVPARAPYLVVSEPLGALLIPPVAGTQLASSDTDVALSSRALLGPEGSQDAAECRRPRETSGHTGLGSRRGRRSPPRQVARSVRVRWGELLKGAPLTRAVGAEATQPIPKRRKAPKAPRSPKASTPRRSLDEYKEAFLERFPEGFADIHYRRKERNYKLAASRLLRDPFRRRYSVPCSRRGRGGS